MRQQRIGSIAEPAFDPTSQTARIRPCKKGRQVSIGPFRRAFLILLTTHLIGNASAQVLFYQDFDDAIPGQSLAESPLNWNPLTGGPWANEPIRVESNLHAGWSGNGVSHLSSPSGALNGFTQNVLTPASGTVELSFKCWGYAPLSGSASVGVSTLPMTADRVEFRFEDNSYLLVSGLSHAYFGASFANRTAMVRGYIDLTNLQTWMVVRDETGNLARSPVVPVLPGVRSVQHLWLYEDCRSGQGADFDDIKYRILPSPTPKTISGTVVLSDYSGPVAGQQVEVGIFDDASPTPEIQTVTLGADGSYSVMTLRQGDANVSFKAGHWLRRTIGNLELLTTGLSGLDASLLNGDCDGDNEVSIGDYAVLSAAFGSVPGAPNWQSMADLDGDEEVSIGDYAILSFNFGLSGDD